MTSVLSLPGLQRSLNSIPPSYRHDAGSVALVTSLHHGILFRDSVKSWSTYQAILRNHPLGSRLVSPRLLHSLVAVLWRTRPITRQTFLRLVSIISELRSMGRSVYRWEWNALIHAAGAGFRRTTTQDFEAALDIAQEMVTDSLKSRSTQGDTSKKSRVDIVTINTLLAMASRTTSRRNVQRVLDMLASCPDITPDRITHLTLLNQHGRNGRLDRIPGYLVQLMQTESGIGVDGINATMWAYARSGRIDYALRIYERLRLNLTRSGRDTSPSTVEQNHEGDRHPILSLPYIDRALALIVPDRITYTALVQCLAYHGDFANAISVFRDWVGAITARPPLARYISRHVSESANNRVSAPLAEMYRSLFIGFTRHGVPQTQHEGAPFKEEPRGTYCTLFSSHHASPFSYCPRPPKSPYVSPNSHSSWTLQSLSELFDNFLEAPSSQTSPMSDRVSPSSTQIKRTSNDVSQPPVPSQVIYWALIAFSRTTNADREMMRAAWRRMAQAFHLESRYTPQPPRCSITHTPSSREGSTRHQGRSSHLGLTGSGKTDNEWRPRGRLKRLVKWVEFDED